MYIRKTKTKKLDGGGAYYTYRIVESVRLGKQVKQRTLLNLGKNFAIDAEHWPLLIARIEQLLEGSEPHQHELFHLADELTPLLGKCSPAPIAIMFRPLRLEITGALYHIASRGEVTHKDDEDHEAFLDVFAELVVRYHWIAIP